jgi:hypothetical protein
MTGDQNLSQARIIISSQLGGEIVCKPNGTGSMHPVLTVAVMFLAGLLAGYAIRSRRIAEIVAIDLPPVRYRDVSFRARPTRLLDVPI